jgi:hypothetical protein
MIEFFQNFKKYLIIPLIWTIFCTTLYLDTIIFKPDTNFASIGKYVFGEDKYKKSFNWQEFYRFISIKFDPSKPYTIVRIGSEISLNNEMLKYDYQDIGVDQFCIKKTPTFSLYGFLSLIFFPFFLMLFLGVISIVTFWPRKKEIFGYILHKVKDIKNISVQKFKESPLFVQIYIITVLAIFLYECYSRFFGSKIFLLIVCILPFIIQQFLYYAVYTVTKAIKDAQK